MRPFSPMSKTTWAAPRMWPASRKVTVTPSATGNGPIVVDADKLPDRFVGIRRGVKRFDGREALLGALLGDERGVIPLDLGRILEHDAGQVARGERAVDVPLEPLAAEVGQVATVINMRVAEDDRIDLLRVERKVTVSLDGFSAPPLEEAALQQQSLAVKLKEIERPGRRAGGAEEMDSHGREIAVPNGKVERKVVAREQGRPPAREIASKCDGT